MSSFFEVLKTGTLIGKYLTGKETEKEQKLLHEWIDEKEENKTLFDSIRDEKQLVNSIKEYDQFSPDVAWKRYSQSITKQSRKEMYFRWKVAASIIVIVTLSVVVLFNNFPQKEPVVAEVTQPILPGEPKAFIEFCGGAKFDLQNLDGEQQEKLARDAGIVVDGITVIKSKVNEAESRPEILAIVTPRGGEYKMVLDDGTQVWLNADSRMEFPNKFSEYERKVKLSGEAFFSVSKDATRPFIVSLNGMEVEVLGTEFNISAYGDDAQIQTTLVEGKVSVKSMQEPDGIQNILLPGEQASFNKCNNVISIRQVDVLQFISWRDGRFVFSYQTLGEITKVLERWYDVDFVFASNELKDIPFSGEFLRYENIEKVYEIIRKTGTKLNFKQNGRTIEISN
ncbi:FecR family protein [Mariniphaga sediminis]|uniref:FecR family protein n=1 Tax=Mariniphaga sediminis TaxID=1628158 RepID=A0A399CZ33_9BACT|nr:FecR domain-containing protein [Mariniphaga sediminis]RIH63661.1 FecR family protein [Mariniphaga sediminis]